MKRKRKLYSSGSWLTTPYEDKTVNLIGGLGTFAHGLGLGMLQLGDLWSNYKNQIEAKKKLIVDNLEDDYIYSNEEDLDLIMDTPLRVINPEIGDSNIENMGVRMKGSIPLASISNSTTQNMKNSLTDKLNNTRVNIPYQATWEDFYRYGRRWDFGGAMNKAGGYADITGDILDLFKQGSAINEANVNTAKQQVGLKIVNLPTYNSLDALMSGWDALRNAKTDWSYGDMHGANNIKRGINSITGAVGTFGKGLATTGNIWAAAAMGVTALGSGIAGMFRADKKAKEQRDLANLWAAAANLMTANNLMNNAAYLDLNLDAMNLRSFAAEGGSIHIDPSKRGTFTAAASKHNMGVQEFANKVLSNKENYSPAMVKKANFAKNASKWHAFGGDLMTHGGNWTNGLTWFNNGGTHEENPNEGIPLGIAPDGAPNLVEEGEVKWNDYIFSDRLKVNDEMKSKYRLPKDITFAKAVKKLSKESEERPNDPISQNGLDVILNDLMQDLEFTRQEKQIKEANLNKAHLGAYGLSINEYNPNILEEVIVSAPKSKSKKGQLSFSPKVNYISSEYIKNKEKYNFVVNKLNDLYLEELNEDMIKKINRNNKIKEELLGEGSEYSKGGHLYYDGKKLKTYSRYAPIIGSGLLAASDVLGLTNLPDYSDANSIISALSGLRTIGYSPKGTYLKYNPVDALYVINQLLSNANAHRRAVRNTGTTSALKLASLAYANAQSQDALGKTLLGIDSENLTRYNQTVAANNALDLQNAQLAVTADKANMSNNLLMMDAYLKAAQTRTIERQAAEQARAANYSNFLLNLGNLGNENFAFNLANTNPGLRYSSGTDGTIDYKSLGYKFNPITGEKLSCGGYLTMKDKKKRRK